MEIEGLPDSWLKARGFDWKGVHDYHVEIVITTPTGEKAHLEVNIPRVSE